MSLCSLHVSHSSSPSSITNNASTVTTNAATPTAAATTTPVPSLTSNSNLTLTPQQRLINETAAINSIKHEQLALDASKING